MSKLLLIVCLAVTAAWAVEPQPAQKTAAELAWEAIPDTIPDADQVTVAKEYLDKYPNEIPLLRNVQGILNRKSDLTVEFWKERMDKTPTSANRYLYARKTGDAAEMKTQSEWIMKNDSDNFWGYYLAAVAEWSKEEHDAKVVANFFEQAIAKDPSRPEGWGYAAEAYEETKDWDNALRCYQASMVVEPESSSPKMSMMGIYAQKRDADKYFAMAKEVLPIEPPLELSLATYGSDRQITTADLIGKYSVVEMFTYW